MLKNKYFIFFLFLDYDVVIKILLLQRQFKNALNFLENQPNPIFYYKYAPELLSEIPEELIKSLINNRKILNVSRLLPVFYKCFEEVENNINKTNLNSKMVIYLF